MNRTVLEADCVVKRFGTRLILNAASLRAEEGAITALLGRNGTGKSTLLRIMCGLVQPDGGTVRIDNAPVERPTLAYMARRGVFFLPDRELLHPMMSLREQLDTAARVRGPGVDVDHVAHAMGIHHRLHARPHQLSGGELRRSEFAFGLCCAPRVLIADEPLRGIQPIDADQILSALRPFANAGCAIVLTGHEVSTILPHVDRINWCVAGTTRQFGSTLEALTDFGFRRDFLGVKDAKELARPRS